MNATTEEGAGPVALEESQRAAPIGVCSLCGGDVAAPTGRVECQKCGAIPAPVVIQMVKR